MNGTEVKNLGDGLMVVFASTSAALSCAVAMQQCIDRDNRARHVKPGHPVPRPAEPEAQQPHQVRLACHHMPGTPVHPGRPDLDEDLVVADVRPGHLVQPHHVLGHGAVPALRDRPHRGRAGRRDWFCLLGQLRRLHSVSL